MSQAEEKEYDEGKKIHGLLSRQLLLRKCQADLSATGPLKILCPSNGMFQGIKP